MKAFFESSGDHRDAALVVSGSDRKIAIVGAGVRLPGADTLEGFWQLLAKGSDFIGHVPGPRAEDFRERMQAMGASADAYEPLQAAYLDDADCFDNAFFRLPPRQAELMDPHHRVFLETSWHALENAGYAGSDLRGSDVGVYVGYSNDGVYKRWLEQDQWQLEEIVGLGNHPAILGSRLSFLHDLRGPTLTVDTSCSSSLVAVHLACAALRRGECRMALAGGVKLILEPAAPVQADGPSIRSATGRTRAFAEGADGTGLGEGCVVFALKRLEAALEDGDHILAVISGSATNQDGNSIGMAAPNVLAQRDVLTKAWTDAGVESPEEIAYIEAHGTGTKLGDPLEVEAITRAFRQFTPARQITGIGSVKTNLGHLDHAAGAAGLLKAILCLRHGQIAPSLHFDVPNPEIDFAASPVFVVDRVQPFPRRDGRPLKCGVSSFGMSGTNCHVVLEEWDAAPVDGSDADRLLPFTLSAPSMDALRALVVRYRDFLADQPSHDLADLCFTSNLGRMHFGHRLGLLVKTRKELFDFLSGLAESPVALEGERIFLSAAWKRPRPETGEEETGLAARMLRDYVKGSEVDWTQLHDRKQRRRVPLPAYPFQRKRLWLEIPNRDSGDARRASPSASPPLSRGSIPAAADVSAEVRKMVAALCGVPEESLSASTTWYALGIDSVSILELVKAVEDRFGARIPYDKFFTELNALGELVSLLEARVAKNGKAAEGPARAESPKPAALPDHGARSGEARGVSKGQRVVLGRVYGDEDIDREYLRGFAERYSRRTAASKALAGKYRPIWASYRAVAGFHPAIKEMIYPIVARSGAGSRMVDADGNGYVDFCMGFGVELFGHNPGFVNECLRLGGGPGLTLGVGSDLPGEVAALICEMTGSERVAFYTSGTEAVMVALRLARAASGRQKIVVFEGSFHGTADAVYVRPHSYGEPGRATPYSIGVPEAFAEEICILEYGVEASLEFIARHRNEIGAVLVEPVQSRHPDLQPGDFLRRLRELTSEADMVLVFDEIITGFRLGLGGAQAYFGVSADLVLYGKVVGGGLPIGIVAGKARILALLDGGMWSFGDESLPSQVMVQSAGTFSCHPLSMLAARATLEHLKAQGPELYEGLNRRSEELAASLNRLFAEFDLPIRVEHCGSLFCFSSETVSIGALLVRYELICRGIFLRESGPFFLSTAHSEEDAEAFCLALRDAVRELIAAGQLRPGPGAKAVSRLSRFVPARDRETLGALLESDPEIEAIQPLSPLQEAVLSQSVGLKGSGMDIVFQCFLLEGALDAALLRDAWKGVLDRHEVTRAAFRWRRLRKPVQIVYREAVVRWNEAAAKCGDEAGRDEALNRLVAESRQATFDLEALPLMEFQLLRCGPAEHLLVWKYHSAILDAWSQNVMLAEVAESYGRLLAGDRGPWGGEPLARMADFFEWFHARDEAAARRYWETMFEGAGIPRERPALEAGADSGEESLTLSRKVAEALEEFARSEGLTLNTLFLAAWARCLADESGSGDVVAATVVSLRRPEVRGADRAVGMFTNLLPFRISDCGKPPTPEWLKDLQRKFREMHRHSHVGVQDLLAWRALPYEAYREAVGHATIVYLNYPVDDVGDDAPVRIRFLAEMEPPLAPRRLFIHPGARPKLCIQYHRNRWSRGEIVEALRRTHDALERIAEMAGQPR